MSKSTTATHPYGYTGPSGDVMGHAMEHLVKQTTGGSSDPRHTVEKGNKPTHYTPPTSSGSRGRTGRSGDGGWG